MDSFHIDLKMLLKQVNKSDLLRIVPLSGATISEVCRRYQIHHSQFYRWERLARQGALEALRNGTRRVKNGKRKE
ncbi:helix-turn-helix domain-containing protein [Dehalococcoidia bacterium]|nr:helix-turn-helix domain-containing protein [Dehalococcoidia bacterium]